MVNENVISLALTDSEVEERCKQGKINKNSKPKSKSVKQIVIENTITLFNLLNIFLMALLLMVGSYKNMLFMGVVLCNTVIGIFQEIRSKRAVDKLSIVVTSNVRAVRNGEVRTIAIDEIVMDDVVILSSGAQVPCDCRIIDGFCYANEGLLTGESDQIEKNINDELYSGSFISSGEVYAKVIHIGKENYAEKIHSEATYSKKVNSEIMRSLNKILKFCSVIIIPVGIALFLNQYFFNHETLHDSVVSIVAALIGMIPEGLVLLTSTVLAVSVIRLAKHNVLVQQLFCIETLARVDVLCLDKTGTITTGELEVEDIDYLGSDRDYVDKILKSLAKNSLDRNATIQAVNNYLHCGSLKAQLTIPFSSEKKWSGAQLSDNKSYVLGAAECICDKTIHKDLFDKISGIGSIIRVVVLCVSDNEFEGKDKLPAALKPIALLKIKDKIRDNACETIEYFKKQGVQLKVISGDNDKTVRRIARSVGIPNSDKAINASELDSDEKILEAAEEYTVFGRVTPQQKKKFVQALKYNGHTVAMTGDGVNDVLALKEADCSVAIASGSDAAKNISQLVLTDNDFGSMPKVVSEGRRTINNIQRSASLFIVKTLYSIVLSLAFIFVNCNYPFQPLQLSLISGFVIGLPSFVLALEPNRSIVKGNFFKNIVMRAWPSSLIVVIDILTLVAFMNYYSFDELSAMAVILTAFVGVMTVIRIAQPMNIISVILVAVIIAGLSVSIIFFGFVFNIVPLSQFALILLAVLAVFSAVAYNLLYSFSVKRLSNMK